MKRTKTSSPPTTEEAKGQRTKPAVDGANRWRPRSILRPNNEEGLIVALREGRLDRRTSASRDVLALRSSITEDPQAVVRGLLADLLALRGVCLAALVRGVTRLGEEVVDDSGFLHPLVTRYLPETERGLLQAAAALMKLEAANSPQNTKQASMRKGTALPVGENEGVVDISALVLQLSDNSSQK